MLKSIDGGRSTTINGREFKVVVLECPYDIMQYPQAQEYFAKFMALKLKGYLKEYSYGVLPVDSTDFVCNHLTVAEVIDGQLIPITGLKSITYERCNMHKLEFPMYDSLQDDASKEHYEAVSNILKHHDNSSNNIAYNGGWTIDPDLRVDKKISQLMWSLSTMMMFCYYRDYKIHKNLAGAAKRFKVDKMKVFMGYDYLRKKDGKRLEATIASMHNDEPIEVMYLKQFTDAFYTKTVSPFEHYWDDRLTISSHTIEQLEKEAA